MILYTSTMGDINNPESMTPRQEPSEVKIDTPGIRLNLKLSAVSRLARRIPNRTVPFAIQVQPLAENKAVVRTQVSMDKPSPAFDRVAFQSYTGNVNELTREQKNKIRLGTFPVTALEKVGIWPYRTIATGKAESEPEKLTWRHYFINPDGTGKYITTNLPFDPASQGEVIVVHPMTEDDYKALDPLADILISKLETTQ